MSGIEDAIRASAERYGVDPATALAYASRESDFNPNAHASKTIHGLYQMSGDLRSKYGVGDSNNVDDQTRGWAGLLADNKAIMKQRLGRDVTDTEAYYGHHFGPGRAARMMTMDPNTPVDQVFTPYERSINPHFDRAGTVGNLLSSIGSDMDRRIARYGGGNNLDFSSGAEEPEPMDFSQQAEAGSVTAPSQKSAQPLDFSQFGEAA